MIIIYRNMHVRTKNYIGFSNGVGSSGSLAMSIIAISIDTLCKLLVTLICLCNCCVYVGSASTDIMLDLNQFNVTSLQTQIPAEVAKTNFTLNDAKRLVRNKCIEIAGDDAGDKAFLEIEQTLAQLGECVNRIANYTEIQKEIEDASPNGELDAVFNKYCKKRPEAMECISTFNTKLVPCLDQHERKSQDVLMRIVNSLLNFICYKGGDQIALFIAEKGPECLESKREDIQECMNHTFSKYLPQDGLDNVKTLPKFIMSQRQCADIESLETCIVNSLERCVEITPANIVESMFRFIKNETVCRNDGGGGGSAAATLSTSKQLAASANSDTATNAAGASSMLNLLSIFVLIFLWLK